MHFVYVLMDGGSGRLYVGQTNDISIRLNQHRSGQTWTTARMNDVRLIFYEAFRAKGDALRRESYFKTSKGKISLRQIIRESLSVSVSE